MVDQVECLAAKLRRQPLAEAEVLEEREVDIVGSYAANIRQKPSERPDYERARLYECFLVEVVLEPIVDGTPHIRIDSRRARTLIGGKNVQRILPVADLNRRTSLERSDPVHLPSA